MARALLHIGTHKTGTTFVQNTLAANRRLLARHGVIYPEIGRATGHHSLLTRWLDLAEYYHTATPPLQLWRDLGRHAAAGNTLLLSSEEFSRGAKKQVDFAEVRDLLAPFEQVEVVCVLRDQRSFLQSIYLEVSKKRTPPGFPQLLRNVRANGHAAGLFTDYGALLDHLLAAFPAPAIRFVDYHVARAAPGGVLGAILGLCEGAPVPGELHPVAEAAANVSPEPLVAWAAGTVSAPEAPPEALMDQARKAFVRQFGENRASTLYSRREWRETGAHFAPLNAAFVARVQAVQPGFALSDAPDPGTETVWRDDVDAGFWSKFAKAIWQG